MMAKAFTQRLADYHELRKGNRPKNYLYRNVNGLNYDSLIELSGKLDVCVDLIQ